MAKRKWYVVTVGREIGVFETWLEVCPLVQGVSGASHQSFSSEAEAYRMFAAEQAKGNTRIVAQDSFKQTSSRRPRSDRSTHSNVGSASAPPRSPAESSIIVYPEYQFEEPPRNFQTPIQVRPVSPQAPSAVSRSASEPSSKTRRTEIIHSFFKQESPSPNRHTPTSTPKSVSASSRSLQMPDTLPEIVVKTPSWVPSYPKASQEAQILSPLDNSNLSLYTFKESRHASPTQSIRRAGEHPNTPESSIYVSSPGQPTATTVYMDDVDPRSPIVKPSQRELMSMNSLSFVRPSPSVRPLELPYETSLLFRPNPTIVG